MTNHPITPPPELVQQWMTEFYGTPVVPGEACTDLATRAAQWGADQEIEACCEWLKADGYPGTVIDIRAARRPKPPSLKAQALAALNVIEDKMLGPTTEEILIRKALEALPE